MCAGLGVLLAALGAPVTAHATFPGGNGRIAFTWSRGGEGYESGPTPRLVGIVSIRPDGSGRRPVARGGTTAHYAPGGARIAFLRSQRLWVARADGGRARFVSPRTWLAGEHQWSPRGTRLLFERGFHGNQSEALYTVEPDGTGLRRLVKAPNLALSPGAWSPDGRAIVYAQPRVGGGSLVRVVRAGHAATLVAGGRAPTWSRRGLIAYETRDGQVCVIRPRPATRVGCVAAVGGSVSGPSWFPDGRRLMVTYSRELSGTAERWITSPDGTVLTRSAEGEPGPFGVLSPNGRFFLSTQRRLSGPEPGSRLEYTDLILERLDGSGRRLLVRGGQAQQPDWQPRR